MEAGKVEETVINWKNFSEYKNDFKEVSKSVLEQTEIPKEETEEDDFVILRKISSIFAKFGASTKTGSTIEAPQGRIEDLFSKRRISGESDNEVFLQEIQEKTKDLREIIERNRKICEPCNPKVDKLCKDQKDTLQNDDRAEKLQNVQDISSRMVKMMKNEDECRDAIRQCLDEDREADAKTTNELLELIIALELK
ncbi:uncharacterized protein LOC129785903 [Lutzomyia longipalpis]|uniref:uncharacterized protein LOC129785903 n=1 Tax=Lutzomyia longipalpis TaxID=7200 RepID=UPI0024836B45|nr:uncharacterized protein LOC129785903 [Lutzomyia longipalpis]